MRCKRCKGEIGNLAVCPYCGWNQYASTSPNYDTKGVNSTVTITPPAGKSQPSTRDRRESSRISASLSNIEMRSKLCVILLAGIFALQVITMVLLVLK